MNRVFRKVTGESVPDIVKHTVDILKECPWVEVHIGTDSQNHRRSTIYVTAIAYRFGNRGVHYIYHKQKTKKNGPALIAAFDSTATTMTSEMMTSWSR